MLDCLGLCYTYTFHHMTNDFKNFNQIVCTQMLYIYKAFYKRQQSFSHLPARFQQVLHPHLSSSDFLIDSFRIYIHISLCWASQVVLVVKKPLANPGHIRDAGPILGVGRPSGEGNGNLLQYSCLENLIDRGTQWGTVHRVTKSWTRLKRLSIAQHNLHCYFLFMFLYGHSKHSTTQEKTLHMDITRWLTLRSD